MATIQNPYGYNDPTMAAIAGNIARIIAGGESPNEKALREAKLGALGADTEAARALARQRLSEAALNEQSGQSRGDEGVLDFIQRGYGFAPDTVAGVLGFSDAPAEVDPVAAQQIRDAYRTYAGIRMAGPGTQNIRDVNRAAFDASQMGSLLLGESPGAVSMRTAAIEGKPMYDIKDDTFFSQYDPTAPMMTTEKGRMDAGKDTRAPVRVVGPGGKPIYASPAEALGLEAYVDPGQADPIGESSDLLRLVELGLGINKDNAGQFDPAAIQRVFAEAEKNYRAGMSPSSAVELAIQKNPMTAFVDEGWFSDARPRTLATPATPAPATNAAAPVRARNPQTGEVVEFINGQWVKVP